MKIEGVREGESSLEAERWYHIVAVVRGAMDIDGVLPSVVLENWFLSSLG